MKNPSKEQEEKWAEDRRLFFARFCWLNMYKVAPSGKIWKHVFFEKEGIHLDTYAANRIKDGKAQKKS